MAGPGNVLIKIGAETGSAVRELATLDKSLGSTMTTGQKATAGLKKAAIPAAAALGAIGYAAVGATKAAMEDAAAQEHLAGQLKRTANATDAQIAAAEDYITSLSMQTAIADDELRPALGKLAAASHSVAKGQKLLALATDISAQSGESLDTVSDALAKGYLGQTRALGKLVPGVDKATLASKDMSKITAELADLTAGAATEAAGTAEGQYKTFQITLAELQETLGSGLIPVVETFLPLMQKGANFASQHTTAVKVLVGAVAALSGAILVANAGLKAYELYTKVAPAIVKAAAAAQWLWNAALSANPIGLVVVALAALGVALVVAYKKSETFRDIVRGALNVVKSAVTALGAAFDALKHAAGLAFDWITGHWKLALFAFGPVGAAVYVIADHFGDIQRAATAAYNFVTGAWKPGNFAFDAIAGAIRRVAGAFQSVAHWAQAAIDAVRALVDWLGKIHVPKIKLPHIPGTLVAPAYSYPSAGSRRAGANARVAGAGGSGAGVTINVYGAVDPEGTARSIRRILDAHDRRQGRLFGR